MNLVTNQSLQYKRCALIRNRSPEYSVKTVTESIAMASISRSSDDTSTCEESSDVRDCDQTDRDDADLSGLFNKCNEQFHGQVRPSHLARKRKIQCNPSAGVKRSKGRTVNDPKNVSVADRVKQFPDQHLSVSLGKLFCLACRRSCPQKLELHIKSVKHVKGKEALNSKLKRELTIFEALKKYDTSAH